MLIHHSRPPSRRRIRPEGFTAVELLAGLAIASLLLALILPAVQASRELSRRTVCTSQLRQLGLACSAFETAHRRFPPYVPGHTAPYGHLSGHVQLLPFLDQTALFNRIDPMSDARIGAEPPELPDDPELLDVPLPLLTCPSDRIPGGGVSYRACYGTGPGIYRTWSPARPLPAPGDPVALPGILMRGASAGKVTDGLSQTVLYSERVVGDMDPTRIVGWRDVLVNVTPDAILRDPDEYVDYCGRMHSPQTHYSFAGRSWVLGGYHHDGYNHVLSPNSSIPDCARLLGPSYLGAMSARSLHPDGVNVCMADGAVRQVSERVDLRVWRAMATMYGGPLEPVGR